MNRFQISLAVKVLRGGGVLAYPTEGVFGLGCDPLNGLAVAKLAAMKRREVAQGFILIGACLTDLLPFIFPDEKIFEKIVAETPNATTWIVPAAEALPNWLLGPGQTVAVRLTSHPLSARLCCAFGGAVISTSANSRGQRPAKGLLRIRQTFRTDCIDFLLPGRLGGAKGPSEIRDASTGRIVRAGSG